MTRAVLLALGLLAACSRNGGGSAPAPAKPPTSRAGAPAALSGRLARIFTPDMLGANLAYLETVTGPAFKTEGADNLYKVDGCTVIIGATKGKIDNLGLADYGARCRFPIGQYFAQGYDHPIPEAPSFGDLQQGLGGHFSADCLRLCGNAADPVVSLYYQGSHADNFNDLLASVPVNDEPVLTAYQDWSDKLADKHGEDYVVSGKYRTGDDMADVASRDFAPIRPTLVRVGANLPDPGE
ncbi:MAG: hypothetical protein JO127_11325 [Caulobacteraceae bacterium]|nr:hypothetical protein [Caulobacteraceae bacterium]